MLLQMSITASILITLTFVIRFFFREKLPKITFPVLWIVVLFRLLVPISFYTDYSLQGFIDSARDTPPSVEIIPEIVLLDDISIAANDAVLSPTSTIDWSLILLIVWLAGILITIMFFVVSYWKLRQKLRFALPIKNNDFIDEWKMLNRLSRKITILVCDQIPSPLTTGIVRPKIYLPKQMNWADIDGLEYILTHEFYHIKRFDALWKLIALMALCLHWFNPLVWVMCVLANRDLEITCDAWVVKKFGLTSKKTYAFTLIGMAERKRQFIPLGSGFARNATEERIKSIMKGNRASLASVLIAISIVPVFALAAFATPADDPVEILYDNENEIDDNDIIDDEYGNEDVILNSVYNNEYNREDVIDAYEINSDGAIALYSVYNSEDIEPIAFEPEPMQPTSREGVWGINTDPALGHSIGIQGFLDMLEDWNDAIVLSTTGVSTSSFYDNYFSEMWEVELEGQRYIITSWRSTNPTYPHAYEIRIEIN